MKKIIIVLLSLALYSCSKTVVTPQNLTQKIFPQVRGNSLAQKEITIPDDFKGEITILLIGYQQKTQFDIDRWILGLLQAEVPVKIVEVPTIAGMMPQMVQSFIDNGMRSGIPKEDWASVVTVYEDASKIVNLLGNERPQSTYVVLLDKAGQIVWRSNKGYSANQIIEIKKLVASL